MINFNKNFLFFLLSFLIFNCSNDKFTYKNTSGRYRIKYPKLWVAINSGNDKKREEEFTVKLERESPFSEYKGLDVAIFNPDSSPPIFEEITVKSDSSRMSVSNLEGLIDQIYDVFSLQLMQKFGNVKKQKSGVVDFKGGKILVFEYSFKYKNIDYYTDYTIIPSKVKGTYYFNAVCRTKNLDAFSTVFNEILYSFQKY